MKGGLTKRLSSERNSSSAASGGKTAGETRTGTGGDGGDEGKTDGKRNNAGGPKTGSGMVLSKGEARQAAKTRCNFLAMDWMSASRLGPGFSS